jgi:hypothetical protein
MDPVSLTLAVGPLLVKAKIMWMDDEVERLLQKLMRYQMTLATSLSLIHL